MHTETAVQNPDDRRALAAVAAQFWVNGMVYAAIIPRLPDIRDRLSLDISTLGLILTVSALGGLIGSAFGGPAVIRFGTKRCITIGSTVTLAVLPTVGLAPSALFLVLSLGLIAMVDVIIDIAMNIQGSRLSARRTTPVMNRLHGLWSLGTVIGGLVAVRAAASDLPLWGHLTAVSAVLALTLLVSLRYLLASDEASGDETLGDPAGSERTADGSPSSVEDATARAGGLRSPLGYALLLGLLGGAAVTMEMTTSDWAAFRLADDLSAAPGKVGLGFVAFTSGMVTGRFVGDNVQAKVGAKSLIRWAAVLAGLGISMATILPEGWYSGVGWLTPTAVTIAGYYLAALGVSVIFPQLYDSAAKAPGPAGRGLAALTAGTRVSGLLAPVIVGFVADTDISVGAAVALVTLPCCVATFAISLSTDD